MLDSLSDKIIDGLKENFVEAVVPTAEAIVHFIDEASYTVALFGGGITIMMRMAGSEKAMTYFWGIQIANIFIKGLLGGLYL